MYIQKYIEYLVFRNPNPKLSIFKCPIKIDSYSDTHCSQSSVTQHLIGGFVHNR